MNYRSSHRPILIKSCTDDDYNGHFGLGDLYYLPCLYYETDRYTSYGTIVQDKLR